VGFAAADTYVVVLALPDMMTSVDLNVDQLQRAAPIVSGFLLGYIAMLPLIGRIADLRGRIPVLVGSLVVFSLGSLVTAASYDLATMVTGRFIQGVGGGGLVPATLALVADIWAVERRGMPLGVVGAVQELGSVLGPLYGAAVLAVSTWRAIFWLNLAAGLLLAVALLALSRNAERPLTRPEPSATAHRDWIGTVLAGGALTVLALVMVAPHRLTSGVTTGLAYLPYFGDSRWATPMALACYVLTAAFLVRQLTATRPLVDLRGVGAVTSSADLLGAGLLAIALGGVVLAFATADPKVEVVSSRGTELLLVTAIASGLFVWRQRRAAAPLVPRHALTARPAWGALVVSFFVGSALIAALVDIPVFARVTVYENSQLGAALVLVRLLAALPVGALVGGYLLARIPVGYLAGGGMTLAAAGFLQMTRWDLYALHGGEATAALAVCGFGFGLAIAPVNAALLAATRAEVHGVASALLIVTRMIGMLVGISALTTIGLRRFYALSATIPSIAEVCHSQTLCHAYVLKLKEAGIAQLHTIFFGAAVCAAIAVLLAVVLLRSVAAPQQGVRTYGL
jgi:MFS transporter, DHA2 family, triacylglyceride efflux pump